MSKTHLVIGIGTNVGKTITSAILSEALEATYWKPIQAGDLDNSDSFTVKNLCSKNVLILPEKFKLTKPCSPHLAAKIDGIHISEFDLPKLNGNLIVESAGGLMVPLNENGLLFLDLIQRWKVSLIVVSRHYLGSINHTLLTLEVLKKYKLEVNLLVFVGDENPASESAILKKFQFKNVHRIPEVKNINSDFIKQEALIFKSKFPDF
jgi:dethiobiotin synthetase